MLTSLLPESMSQLVLRVQTKLWELWFQRFARVGWAELRPGMRQLLVDCPGVSLTHHRSFLMDPVKKDLDEIAKLILEGSSLPRYRL